MNGLSMLYSTEGGIHACRLCPRMCGANRQLSPGFCQAPAGIVAARAALHHWEEPCISGTRGSGTVFFSGCTLRCCFCQNYKISRETFGRSISPGRLSEIFLELQQQGAHNINLVTATHYLPWILPALDMVRGRLSIPVVYNCGGYERLETVQALKDYVDIWLPDLKYQDSRLSGSLSQAPDYFAVASRAIRQMIDQTGPPVFDRDGLMKRGVIIRHLVLPGHRDDSIRLLQWMAAGLPADQFYISLLSQYTPYEAISDFPELNRRITSYEYEKVLDAALELGLDHGFMQKKSSAREEYTPPFELQGL
ncbi:MAG: radical SAM protein [Eubacteriales bacterium]|nr:radical SAM protein [Eubacteriales bacterium]